jgi:hypothetical protein
MEPIGTRQFYRIVVEAAQAANIARRVGPNTLRRSFATHRWRPANGPTHKSPVRPRTSAAKAVTPGDSAPDAIRPGPGKPFQMNRSYPGLSCPHGIRWRSIGDGKRFIVELGGSQMAVVVSAPGLVSEPFFGSKPIPWNSGSLCSWRCWQASPTYPVNWWLLQKGLQKGCSPNQSFGNAPAVYKHLLNKMSEG